MLFSICIPAYNAEDSLSKCLDSILNQSFKDYEIVVADDGSRDKTGMIADEYSTINNNIKVIHDSNHGTLHARINALREAKGEYILFVDSDDSIMPDSLQKLSEFIKITMCDVVIYNNIITLPDNRQKRRILFGEENFIWKDKTALVQKFITTNSLNTLWNKAIKNGLIPLDLFENYPRIQYAEDWMLSFFPIVQGEKIGYCSDLLYNYSRMNGNSLITKFSPSLYTSLKYKYNLCVEYKELNQFVNKSEISTLFLQSIVNIMVFGRGEIVRREDYFLFLNMITNDDLYVKILGQYSNNVPLNFRWALWLLNRKRFVVLYICKKIISAIRRKIWFTLLH